MKKIFLLIAFSGFLTSCYVGKETNEFLLPSNISSNMKYLPKPYSIDSAKSKIYLQGGWQSYSGAENEDYFKTNAFELSVSRGHQRKRFQFAYGGSFSTGNASYSVYDVDGKNPSTIKNSFSNLLVQASINGVAKIRTGELRYLALDFGYSKEFGDYPDVRKQFEGKQYYTTLDHNSISTVGLGSEVCFTHGIVKLAIKLGVAKNLGSYLYVQQNNSYFKNELYPYVSIHASYRGVTITSQASENTGRIGLGYEF